MARASIFTRTDKDHGVMRWFARDPDTEKLLGGSYIPLTDWSRSGINKAAERANKIGEDWATARGREIVK
jgi:hypothetical protein